MNGATLKYIESIFVHPVMENCILLVCVDLIRDQYGAAFTIIDLIIILIGKRVPIGENNWG